MAQSLWVCAGAHVWHVLRIRVGYFLWDEQFIEVGYIISFMIRNFVLTVSKGTRVRISCVCVGEIKREGKVVSKLLNPLSIISHQQRTIIIINDIVSITPSPRLWVLSFPYSLCDTTIIWCWMSWVNSATESKLCTMDLPLRPIYETMDPMHKTSNMKT